MSNIRKTLTIGNEMVKPGDQSYILFDANIWRGNPALISSYAQRPAEERRTILCGPWTLGEVTTIDPLKYAIAATDRMLNEGEIWARRSDAILRSILSIVEFEWSDSPRILANLKETNHYLKVLREVLGSLKGGETRFAKSQNEIRDSRQAGIPGNQSVFEKHLKRLGLSRSKKTVDTAFEELSKFDTRSKVFSEMCQVFVPVLFAHLRGADEYSKRIIDRLDEFVSLKRGLYVFLYQIYKQLILGERDHSYICDWRTLIEMPEDGVLVTRDKPLREAAKLCQFILPIISESEIDTV